MDSIKFGTNQYCGPSVLSAIAGITTDEAASLLQSIIGNTRPIKGVYEGDLIKAFESLKYNCNKLSPSGSVFSMMFNLQGKDGYYIFTVPGHYIAIEVNGNHRFICDNHTKEPIKVSSSARLGQRVISCFMVEKK